MEKLQCDIMAERGKTVVAPNAGLDHHHFTKISLMFSVTKAQQLLQGLQSAGDEGQQLTAAIEMCQVSYRCGRLLRRRVSMYVQYLFMIQHVYVQMSVY